MLGVPVPFHNFFPKFITIYVLTKMSYLCFLLISALQARTPCVAPDLAHLPSSEPRLTPPPPPARTPPVPSR